MKKKWEKKENKKEREKHLLLAEISWVWSV